MNDYMIMEPLNLKSCWCRGLTVNEASGRLGICKVTVTLEYAKLDKEMREFFIQEKEKEM